MGDSLLRYVALGDSTGVGVGANDGGYPERLFRRLKAAGFPIGILNLAESGATTRDVIPQVQKAVLKRPALVTLGIGANDLWRLVPAGTFAMQLKLIADALEKSGARVVVSNLVDLSLAPVAALVESMLRVPMRVFAQRVDELNASLDALARRPRFTVVDLLGFSRRELRGHPEFFAPDGFHPSAAGYDRWADLLYPAVEAAARAWQQEQSSAASTG